MAISASMVKELRESTGAGMMDCKKALTQANGDLEKAVEILREKGLAAAAKKAGRIAAEGAVVAFVNEDSKVASLVEVNCETDFVAANDEFLGFANKVAEIAANSNATTVEELSAEKCDGESTIDEVRTALVAKLGENMTVRRFVRFSVENGAIQSYIHAAGKIGVLVQLGCENNSPVLLEVAKDVAMHIAAVNPLFLDSSAVDAETLEKEREIYRVQAQNEGNPANIVE